MKLSICLNKSSFGARYIPLSLLILSLETSATNETVNSNVCGKSGCDLSPCDEIVVKLEKYRFLNFK